MDGSLQDSRQAVLVKSSPITDEATRVQGPNFENGVGLGTLLQSYETIGFQASSLHRSIEIINKMRKWRLSDDDPTVVPGSPQDRSTRIFLGFTSNLISSGLRDVIRYLTKHNMVSVIVTTAGGIEEDLIKCLGSTYLMPQKSFSSVDGAQLRSSGLNRIGNLVVPNDNYCRFEDWVLPILTKMRNEQLENAVRWSPSKVIERLGLEINHPDSFLFWAAKNQIPVFCPALTDGC